MVDWFIDYIDIMERTVTTTPTSWQCVEFSCQRVLRECEITLWKYKVKFVNLGNPSVTKERTQQAGRTSLGRHPIDHFFPPVGFK